MRHIFYLLFYILITMENNMISEKIVNGVKVHFNHDHYMDVRKVHELKNKIVKAKKPNVINYKIECP